MTDQSRCILVIDDDTAVLDHVQDVLQSAGFQIVRATNGLDGLKQLNS